jgi:hypothetical protein
MPEKVTVLRMVHKMRVNLSRMACGAVLPMRLLPRSGLILAYQRYKRSLIPFLLPNLSSNNLRSEHGIRLFCDMPEHKKYQYIRITREHESIDHAFGFLMDILKDPISGNLLRGLNLSEHPTILLTTQQKAMNAS